MPLTCTICRHKARMAIELQLGGGDTLRDVARQHHTTKDALQRHKHNCMPDKGNGALERRGEHSADAWIANLLADIAECRRIAKEQLAPSMRLAAMDRVLKATEMQGKALRVIGADQVQQLFVTLQVRDESELRSALDLRRSIETLPMADLHQRACDTLRTLHDQQPELVAETRLLLFGEREIDPETNGGADG